MTQYIAMMWTEKKGKLLQTFGPYPSESAAQDACERISQWPMAKNGVWEVTELYPDPPERAPVAYPAAWGGTVYVYPQPMLPRWQYANPPTITLYGNNAIPLGNTTITYRSDFS